jgi:hypothetical protein
MNSERTQLSRQLTVLAIFTIAGSAFRFLPYWKEQHDGWLMCVWGANAVLPLFMLGISKCKSLAWAYVLPMIGFVISDVVIQWMSEAKNLPTSSLSGRLAIYAIFLVLAQLGLIIRYLKLSRLETILMGTGVTLVGSVLFFLITNTLIWMKSTPADGMYYYPLTWAGLMHCYELALPFFKNQFFGDAIISFSFFAAYSILEDRYLVKEPNPAIANA